MEGETERGTEVKIEKRGPVAESPPNHHPDGAAISVNCIGSGVGIDPPMFFNHTKCVRENQSEREPEPEKEVSSVDIARARERGSIGTLQQQQEDSRW